jgi:hypothetical protein
MAIIHDLEKPQARLKSKSLRSLSRNHQKNALMGFMFWKKKPAKTAKPSPEKGKPSREDILAQAKANAAAARAEIGDETLDKIKAAMLKKQASAIEQAKNQIKSHDIGKVRDHLSIWLDKDDK